MDSPLIHAVATPAALVDGPAALGRQELAVLRVFLECRGRVIGRAELARRAGLSGLNQRRCDSLLVDIRRVLGADAVRTVRGRGWMLEEFAMERAAELIAD